MINETDLNALQEKMLRETGGDAIRFMSNHMLDSGEVANFTVWQGMKWTERMESEEVNPYDEVPKEKLLAGCYLDGMLFGIYLGQKMKWPNKD